MANIQSLSEENTSLPGERCSRKPPYGFVHQTKMGRVSWLPKSCCLIRSILAASCSFHPKWLLLLVLIASAAGTLFAEHRQAVGRTRQREEKGKVLFDFPICSL